MKALRMTRASSVMTTIALTIATISAQASTFTMVDCLSSTSTADITIHLTDIKTTEVAHVFRRAQGTSEKITKGQVQEYSESRFFYTGKVGTKTVVVDVDLNSVESNNGTVTIAGKADKAQCFVTDTKIED